MMLIKIPHSLPYNLWLFLLVLGVAVEISIIVLVIWEACSPDE